MVGRLVIGATTPSVECGVRHPHRANTSLDPSAEPGHVFTVHRHA